MNNSGEYYINMISEYIINMPPIPTFKEAPIHEVQQASYRHWAAGMVLERFENAYRWNQMFMYDDPLEILQEFVDEMEYYYGYTSKRNQATLMFFVAMEEGKRIGLLFV